MTGSLTECYDDRIAGVLSCYDRVVVTGTLPTVCYAAGMTKFLHAIGVHIFDYPQFASTLRARVRERAASLAAQAGSRSEHIAKSHIRKEAVVAEVLKRRGEYPGLVDVISAMEACGASSRGTTSRRTRPSCGRTAASVNGKRGARPRKSGKRTRIVNHDTVFCDQPQQCGEPPAPTMPARFTPRRDDRYILPSALFVQAPRQGSLPYTLIRHALGHLEGRKAVEQDGNGGWRIASEANS
jgi:hypothetical protein